MELARYVDQIKPPTVIATAPGWAYGGGKGTPINWSANVLLRRKIEALCQATNGHSYGYSYADNVGGSFIENLATYGGVEDGWPKECLNTETGTNNWHSERNGAHIPTTQPHAVAFDRILRAHIAVVDRTMQHAAIFDDFSLFKPLAGGKGDADIEAYPGVGTEEPRLIAYRRLALAYATHGAPLPYTLVDPAAVAGKKVLFRPVDTAALPAQKGSDATSDRILLNFINFENTPQTLHVKVTLPVVGAYAAVRYGPQLTYSAARTELKLQASPVLELTEKLEGGQAVQYILTAPGPRSPYPPTDVNASPDEKAIGLNWTRSADASSYIILRAASEKGPFTPLGSPVEGDRFTDASLIDGTRYFYQVRAANAAGQSAPSQIASTVAGEPAAPADLATLAGDRRVTLTWTPPARANTYSLERSENRDGPFTEIAVNLAAPRFTDATITNGRLYYYRVWARNEHGRGQASQIAWAMPQAPPPAPASLVALPGDRCVILSWLEPAPGLTYHVKRSMTAGKDYTWIAADVASSTFTDNSVNNGKTYHYVVSAVAEGPEGPDSPDASAAPAANPLPPPWRSAAIGNVAQGGAATAAGAGADATFTVIGSGSDIWGKADSMRFAWAPLAGDAGLTVHVASFDETNPWAKIGVMIRASADPSSAMAILAISPGKGDTFTHRDQTDALCTMSGGAPARWLTIYRQGDSVDAWVSDDGAHWRNFGSINIKLPHDALIGLAVCSHGNDLNKAVFDHLRLTNERPTSATRP
jgi:fibronectin type 3 domain-containing protein